MGVPLGVADGVTLGTVVAVRVGAAVPVGLGGTDGVADAMATEALGDGAAPLAPKAVPSQPVRIAPRDSRSVIEARYLAGPNRLLDNGDPPDNEMVTDGLTSSVGHWQAGARRQ